MVCSLLCQDKHVIGVPQPEAAGTRRPVLTNHETACGLLIEPIRHPLFEAHDSAARTGRAGALDQRGELDVESTPGEGTEVVAWIPWDAAREKKETPA